MTYGDGKHVHVVALRVALEPDVVEDGSSGPGGEREYEYTRKNGA